MKILIAVDGSAAAFDAVQALIGLLPQWRTAPELHLLNVQPPVASGLVRRFLPQPAVEDYLRDEGRTALEAAEQALAGAGLPFTTHLRVGEAAPEVVACANELGAGLIVVGTRGHSGVRAALLGSTARRVVELSEIPVLVMP